MMLKSNFRIHVSLFKTIALLLLMGLMIVIFFRNQLYSRYNLFLLGPTATTCQTSNKTVIFGLATDCARTIAHFRFNFPSDYAEDGQGRLYVSDTQSHVIRRIENDQVTIFAGTLIAGYNGDNHRLQSDLNKPTKLVLRENALFFLDSGNFLIRKINLNTDRIETVAGQLGKVQLPVIGKNIKDSPIGLSSWFDVDSEQNIWIATSKANYLESHIYRTVDSKWTIFPLPNGLLIDQIKWFHLYPNGDFDLSVHKQFVRVQKERTIRIDLTTTFSGSGVFSENDNSVYLADHNLITKVRADNSVVRMQIPNAANISSIGIAQNGFDFFILDSDAGTVMRMNNSLKQVVWPIDLKNTSFLAKIANLKYFRNKLYVLDNLSPAIFTIETDNNLAEHVAGNQLIDSFRENKNIFRTGFFYPTAIAIDQTGNIFVAENNRILKLTIDTQKTSVFCGAVLAGNVFNRPCDNARFNGIRAIEFDETNSLIVADTYNNQIKKISPDGSLVELVAGSGSLGDFINLKPDFSLPAIKMTLNRPHGIKVIEGTLYILDSWNNSIYKLQKDKLVLFSGVPGPGSFWNGKNYAYQGLGGYSGDGGPAHLARLNNPTDLSRCDDGSFLIADEFNNAVRRINRKGLISTVYGGKNGFSKDNKFASYIHNVVCLGQSFYVLDGGNNVITKNMISWVN
jgi:DNA-binding beta-propeller fold protein YncE